MTSAVAIDGRPAMNVWTTAGLLGLFAVAVVATVVAAPLLVYSMTLATFGAAHVLSELRYVDRRFGRHLGIRRLAIMGFMLAGAVAARCSGVFGLLPPEKAVPLELAFVVLLALSAADGSGLRSTLAVTLAIALGAATLAAPFDTAVTLSVLHNLTPLAFLWEISKGRSRSAVMTLALFFLIGLPLLVATGLPGGALLASGLPLPSLDPLHAGPLGEHLYVYVPVPLLYGESATNLFSASVVAQCAHYTAVIVVLPAMLAARDPSARGIVPWPGGWIFAGLIALVSVITLIGFAHGFVPARALYGITASIHAWIEIPLIVIALTGGVHAEKRSPPITEAPLAQNDTIRARAGDNPIAQATNAASTTITIASPATTAPS